MWVNLAPRQLCYWQLPILLRLGSMGLRLKVSYWNHFVWNTLKLGGTIAFKLF
jgi:hypothetical protein